MTKIFWRRGKSVISLVTCDVERPRKCKNGDKLAPISVVILFVALISNLILESMNLKGFDLQRH